MPTTRADCGHEYTSPGPEGGAAGYAKTPDGTTLCYPCADASERVALAAADRFFAYLSSKVPNALTTWTGGHLARVTDMHTTRAGFGNSRVYGHAITPDGARWSFNSPGRGMYARMRRHTSSVVNRGR